MTIGLLTRWYQKKIGLISGLALIIYQTIVITFFRSGKGVFLLFVEGVRISYFIIRLAVRILCPSAFYTGTGYQCTQVILDYIFEFYHCVADFQCTQMC